MSSIERDEVVTTYSLLEVTMDPSTDHRFPIYEEYPSCANSHDSLLQPAYTEESSTDDLTKLNAFFPSTFHSKDSALDLSEENLLQLSSESRSSSTTEQTSKSFFRSWDASHSLHIWTMSTERSLSVDQYWLGYQLIPSACVCVCTYSSKSSSSSSRMWNHSNCSRDKSS